MKANTLTRALRITTAVAALSILPAGAASAAGMADPTVNRDLSSATLTACQADPNSSDCTNNALTDINQARAAEGVPAMQLPATWSTLTGPQQLLVLANLERADRGMKVLVIGLAGDLNRNAQVAAAADSDPNASPWNGDSMSSNWAGGYASTLEADFSWMYDDGVGSPNVDCTSSNSSGCWGHRHDILMQFNAPLVMGAAVGTGQYGTSITELFVGGDTAINGADAPLSPTWNQLSGAVTSTPTAPAGGNGTSTTQPNTNPGAGSSGPGGTPAHVASAGHPGSPSSRGSICRVPRLRGLTVAQALRALARAHCAVGRVVFITPRGAIASIRFHARNAIGHLRVARQSVAAGQHRRAGFPVSLTVR